VLEGTPACYGVISAVLGDDSPLDLRRSLSKEFWGSEAWEYVWFLRDVANTALPRSQLEALLGQPLVSFFGSQYASFRGVDEKDTAAGSADAVLGSLQGNARNAPPPPPPLKGPPDPVLDHMKDLLK